MRQVYAKKKTSYGLDYVYDDMVDPGQILVVRNVSAWWSGIASTEEILFFVEIRGVLYYLGEDTPVVNDGRAYWSGRVSVGEASRVGIYAPDIAATDNVYLWIFGELWDLEDWRNVKAD